MYQIVMEEMEKYNRKVAVSNTELIFIIRVGKEFIYPGYNESK